MTDSSKGILNCVKYALEAAGIQPPDRRTLLQFIGPPLIDSFQETIGMSYEDAKAATEKYRERYSIIGLFENIPYKGISLVLSRLKSQGKILALATSKPEIYSVRILQHFNLMKYFDVTVGSTLDDSRYRKADVIREVFGRLGLSPQDKEDVIMVGDRKQDILAAKECGITSLGVYYGFAELGELEKAGADHIVWAVDEIMQVIGEEDHDGRGGWSGRLSEMEYQRADLREQENRLKMLAKCQQEAESPKQAMEIHHKYYRVCDHVATMSALAFFRYSVDTSDPRYDRENDYYDENMPSFQLARLTYERALYGSPFREELEHILGPVAFENITLRMKSVSAETVPLQQEENRMVSEYEKLLASAAFDWDGKRLGMAGLERYMKDPDRSVRRRAWGMLSDFMQEHGEELDSLYDGLVKNRTRQARKMGYDNFVEPGYHRLQRSCYDQKQVRRFRRQVREYWVPFVTRLQEKRRIRLGLDRLKLIDEGIYFREGNPVPKGTPEQILKNSLKMYQELSPETAEFMSQMTDREMFDVLERPGKRQGGYMDFLPEARMPLIFADLNGTSGDVDVLIHECGHAFQGYLAGKDDVREHWDVTMETAEVHSMSMEFFAGPWMELFFGSDAGKFRRMQLEDAICFIPYGCMVDEIHQIDYEYPKLSKSQRHEIWKRLEKQYRPHLDLSGTSFFEKSGSWQRQQHIYSSPFYYIDYCIAQICALQYKVMMEKDRRRAWKSYLRFCRSSARGFFTDMVKKAGLVDPFQPGFLGRLAHYLGEHMEEWGL